MQDAPFTTEPIVAKQNTSGGLKRLLFGHAASGAYYEALDDAGRWYLWMEFSRFGSLRAYPCVLKDGDETLRYRPYGDNEAFFDRWQTLVTHQTVHTLRITEHTKAEFQKIYQSFRDNEKSDA